MIFFYSCILSYIKVSFHSELRERLNSAAKIYLEDNDNDKGWQKEWGTKENIGDVFVAMKTQFLVYGPFIVMCNNVEKMIGVLKCDTNVKSEVSDLEKQLLKEMLKSKIGQRPTTFNALLALPFQHVLRYCTSLVVYVVFTITL